MSKVRIRTEIPGPNSRALLARRQKAVPRGVYNVSPIFTAKSEGALIEDVDGNVYLDFAGGIGCTNVGHSQPTVIAAAAAQLARFVHTCFSVTQNEPYVALAERLNCLTPGRFEKKTFFANSGAEAVENAVKLARAHTGRPAVVCFTDAFHGRTLLTMSLTSKVAPYKEGFGPFAPEIYRMPYPYCYRCPYGLESATCGVHCAKCLDDFFKRYVEATKVAAVIVEPVLGEGGFVVPPADFFPILQEACRQRGILIIADEVQCGMGRTGEMFASASLGLEPDIVVTAKSLAGGLPLSSITGRADIMDSAKEGGIGGTFGGNPVACAAALAVLDLLEQSLVRAREVGRRLQARFADFKGGYPLVGDARGLGPMAALELVTNRETKEPARQAASIFTRFCYEHGLITITAGTYGNVIRTLMPLTIADAELDEGLDIMEAGLAHSGT